MQSKLFLRLFTAFLAGWLALITQTTDRSDSLDYVKVYITRPHRRDSLFALKRDERRRRRNIFESSTQMLSLLIAEAAWRRTRHTGISHSEQCFHLDFRPTTRNERNNFSRGFLLVFDFTAHSPPTPSATRSREKNFFFPSNDFNVKYESAMIFFLFSELFCASPLRELYAPKNCLANRAPISSTMFNHRIHDED